MDFGAGPLSTLFVEGISWAAPWFMVTNYTALLAVYLCMFLYVRNRNFKEMNYPAAS